MPQGAAASLIDAATYRGDKMLKITSWNDSTSAKGLRDATPRVLGGSLHVIRVRRDYGKYCREEAPRDADEAQAAAVTGDE